MATRAPVAPGIAFAALASVLVVAGIRALPEPSIDVHPSSGVTPSPASFSRRVTLEVSPGDTLSALFANNGVSIVDLDALMRIGGPTARLRTLLPGDRLDLLVDPQGRLIDLAVDIDESRRLEVERGPSGFSARTVEVELQRRSVLASSTIESSLFASASQAGLSGAVTMSLAGVFGYDIDFLQDLRRGDSFTVLYEEVWRDGAKLRDGPILAAEFRNDGRVLRAVRYTRSDGRVEFFAPDGSSMRKALTRNPVDFTRVSSGFSNARKHPILNRVRAHQGVDYAAPAGTPVRAAGDGKVTFRGQRSGYGNVVVVKHGATYSTLYAHLSRFARGLKVGDRVAQDQVIAYVGMTGLATAPHLHYEVLVNGVHRNPRTVKLPDAAPIPQQELAAFQATADQLLSRLGTTPEAIRAAGSN